MSPILTRVVPRIVPFVRAVPIAALLTVGLGLSSESAHAQPVTVRIDTPEFGIRIGQPWPRYAPPVVLAPPPVVYPPVIYPPVVYGPVYPPVVYAPPPRVIYGPVVVPVPRGRGHGHGHRWDRDDRDERRGRVIYAPY